MELDLLTVNCYSQDGKHIRDITVVGIEAAFIEKQKFCIDTGGYAFIGDTVLDRTETKLD